MTDADILRVAKQIGLPHWYQTEGLVNEKLLIQFAHLIAEDAYHCGVQEGVVAGANNEREACANTCYKLMLKENPYEQWNGMKLCMEAIRARGEA